MVLATLVSFVAVLTSLKVIRGEDGMKDIVGMADADSFSGSIQVRIGEGDARCGLGNHHL